MELMTELFFLFAGLGIGAFLGAMAMWLKHRMPQKISKEAQERLQRIFEAAQREGGNGTA
jgi:hypothetical protein